MSINQEETFKIIRACIAGRRKNVCLYFFYSLFKTETIVCVCVCVWRLYSWLSLFVFVSMYAKKNMHVIIARQANVDGFHSECFRIDVRTILLVVGNDDDRFFYRYANKYQLTIAIFCYSIFHIANVDNLKKKDSIFNRCWHFYLKILIFWWAHLICF